MGGAAYVTVYGVYILENVPRGQIESWRSLRRKFVPVKHDIQVLMSATMTYTSTVDGNQLLI